jgi:hypothetical protein
MDSIRFVLKRKIASKVSYKKETQTIDKKGGAIERIWTCITSSNKSPPRSPL